MKHLIFFISLVTISLSLQSQASTLESWILRNAIPIDIDKPLSSSCEKFGDLKKSLRDKRILFLGEPDHYVGELYNFRLTFLKCLKDEGWTTIGLEMGRSDGFRVNEYIQTGDPKSLDEVARLGNISNVLERDLPNRVFGPIDGAKIASDNRLILRDRQFFTDLRGLGTDLFFGFDIDTLPGGGFIDAQKVAQELPGSDIKNDLLGILNSDRANSTYQDDYSRIDRAIKLSEELPRSPEQIEIASILRALKESLQFAESVYHLPHISMWTETESALWLNLAAKREETMFWQLDQALQSDPKKKIVLMGHNLHLAKDSSKIFYDNDLSMQGYWYALRTYLAENYANDVYSIWMLYGDGVRSSGPECPEVECAILTEENTINYQLLQKIDLPTLLPLTETANLPSLFTEESRFLFNGKVIQRTKIKDQADAIFFVPKVSGL